MIIDPGQLDRPITIQRRTLIDGPFNQIEVWADHLSTWAMMRRQSEDEEFAANQYYEVRVATFVTNYTDDVTAVDRLVCEGIIWRILGVGEVGLKHGLEIKCQVLDPQPEPEDTYG